MHFLPLTSPKIPKPFSLSNLISDVDFHPCLLLNPSILERLPKLWYVLAARHWPLPRTWKSMQKVWENESLSGSRSSSCNTRYQPSKSQNQTVQLINPDSSDDSEPDECLFTLNSPAAATSKTKVKITCINVTMVVDTGASVNVIDELTFLKLGQHLPLQICKTHIFWACRIRKVTYHCEV